MYPYDKNASQIFKRMVVWNSSGTKCNVNVCAFGSASWVRNVNPG